MNNIFINYNDIDGLQFGSSSVSKVYFGSNLIYEDTPTMPNYLNFTARNGSVTIGKGGNATPNVSYSYDGTNWTEWDYSNLTIQEDETIYFKGNNPNGFSTSESNYMRFTMIGEVEANGNVQSLLYDDNFETNLVIPNNYCFYRLFYGCTRLTTAPILPATTMADYCYDSMFNGCTSLTSAPTLPATTLAVRCYTSMFQGCTGLTTAPQLPATTLASNCYNAMFYNCTSLTSAPTILPAKTLASKCYSTMFRGCTSLTSAPQLPATTLAEYCYQYMFQGCTSLTTAPQLPATMLANYCYGYMFNGCTSLTSAPTLPATILASNCYQYMFNNCTSLNYIKMKAVDISASSCLSNWVNGVAATGTFVKNRNATWDVSGVNGVPEGWTLEYEIANYLCFTAKNASATIKMSGSSTSNVSYSSDGINWTSWNFSNLTIQKDETVYFKGNNTSGFTSSTSKYKIFQLTGTVECHGSVQSLLYDDNFETNLVIPNNYCFYRLFYQCSGIITAPLVPATTLKQYCYQQMFDGCGFSVPPDLPATTLQNYCYANMFADCPNLLSCPELHATRMVTRCYQYMFGNCSSLATAMPILPATTLAQSCYEGMFSSCPSLTKAPVLPALTLTSNCYYALFRNSSSLNYIKAMFTTTPSTSYTSNWVIGVAASGTFVKNSAATWNVSGVNGVPNGWTVQTASS